MKILTNRIVDISVAGNTVRGVINGSHELWNFKSEDPWFLTLFPSGTLLSFNMYGTASEMDSYRQFHNAVHQKLKEILGADEATPVSRNLREDSSTNSYMETIPDFATVITSEMLEKKCRDHDIFCSFRYGIYKVIAHRCTARNVWEVHIYLKNSHFMAFDLPLRAVIEGEQ